jgi:hypothetical protein
VFVDDTIIFGRTARELAERLAHVLERFEKANLRLQSKKCTFAASKVDYLGHVLGRDGVSPNPEKVKAIENYPRPQNMKEVRAFLGLASFYRRMIPKYADKAKPLR